MAFDKKQTDISRMLKATEPETKSGNRVIFSDSFERTKQYQFTLQPSVRKNIDRLAKENGFRSASSFINDYFKKM